MSRAYSSPALDTTERVRSEQRQSFRLMFETSLRDLTDPDAIISAAVAMLGEHIGAERVG